MKKTLIGAAAVLSILFLLGSCSSSTNSKPSKDDDKSKDTTNEKADLYRSAFGEYTNYYKDKEFSIEEKTFMFEGMKYAIDPETDLYYTNELPAGKNFEGKYDLTNGYGNGVAYLYIKTIVEKEDNDTLTLEKWMENYYFEEADFEAHNTYSYEAEQENEEWYQLLSDGFYDCNNDVLYKKLHELRKYHAPSYYSKALYLCPKSTSYFFGIYFNSEDKVTSIYKFEPSRIAKKCTINKISDFKKDRLKKTDASNSWYGLEDAEGNFYNTIDPINNPSELEKLVEEAFAEEIKESGLSAYQWENEHDDEWRAKRQEIIQYYLDKVEELEKEETYEGINETSYSVYPKNSGSTDNGNDDNDDDDDSGNSSVSASDFEGITWKYKHAGTGSTTTQNVEFNNGTVKVTTITASNNSSTTHTNRELSGTYSFSNGKITITYEEGGYDVTADYKVSVSSDSLTLKGDDDDTSAVSLLGVLFQNTSGTASITFTKD